MGSGGRFEILEPLGAGALGRLYRARDGELGRAVALRIVSPAVAEDLSAREALLAGARQAASLSHPHAAALLDIVLVRHAHEILCLVHELVEGRPLSAVLAEGSLPAHEAIELAAQVAEALAAAANVGLAHGALDPDGIIVSADRHAKVLDFGVSRWTACANARAAAVRMLEAGESSDRPSALYYVSPEQLLGGPVDGRADIFALGAILYEMLTGGPAFAGESETALLLQILQANPQPPSRLNPAVPPEADRIVLRALAKSLDTRYATADAVAADLRQLLAAFPVVSELAAAEALPALPPAVEAVPPAPIVLEAQAQAHAARGATSAAAPDVELLPDSEEFDEAASEGQTEAEAEAAFEIAAFEIDAAFQSEAAGDAEVASEIQAPIEPEATLDADVAAEIQAPIEPEATPDAVVAAEIQAPIEPETAAENQAATETEAALESEETVEDEAPRETEAAAEAEPLTEAEATTAPASLFETRREAPPPAPVFAGFFDRPSKPGEAQEDAIAAAENQPTSSLLLIKPAPVRDALPSPKRRVEPPPAPPKHHKRPAVRPAVWGMVAAAAVIVLLAGVAWFGRNALDLPWQDRVSASARPYVMITSFSVVENSAPAYFGPGFAEDLAARVSEIPGVTVVGRTAVRETPFQSDWRVRAQKAGASVVVRGTIKPGPYALHADVELLDVGSGGSIWSRHFAREPRQVSALQAEIAGQLAQKLRLVTPTSNRWARASVRKTDPAAYDLYLQGREAAEKRDRARAIGLYDQALQRDPGLVEARAALSQAIYLEEYYAGGTRDAASSGRALREAEAALAVDAELPAAHLAAALAAPTITLAASSLARVLAFDPSNGEAWHHAGDLMNEVDPPRSIAFYRASLALEPSIDANWRDLASAYATGGSAEGARDAIERGEAARPDRPWWKQMRARLDVEQGRYDAAIQALGTDPSVETAPVVWLMGRVVPMAMAGRLADARREASRLVDRYPAYCEGGAVLAAIERDSGSLEQGRQRADAILSAAARPDAEPPMKVCAALAAAGTGDPAEAASWMSKLAGDERALRLWTRQAIFGPSLSFRSGWYPWNKVLASQPMQVAAAQLTESLQRIRDEVERRLPAPPGSTVPER